MPIRAQCTICSDFFDHSRDVAAIHCGHTFHHEWCIQFVCFLNCESFWLTFWLICFPSVLSGGFRQPPQKPVHNVENRYSNKPLNCTNLDVSPDILKGIVVFSVGQHQTHYFEALLWRRFRRFQLGRPRELTGMCPNLILLTFLNLYVACNNSITKNCSAFS